MCLSVSALNFVNLSERQDRVSSTKIFARGKN